MGLVSLSVRAKLALLVGLPVALMGAAVPILAWEQRRELLDAASAIVQEAEDSFDSEMESDRAALDLAAQIMSTQGETLQAIRTQDATQGLAVAGVFAKYYPQFEIAIAARDGRVLGRVGSTPAPKSLREIPELGELTDGQPRRLMVAHGCSAAGQGTSPAQAVLAPVGTEGWLLVCEPLDRDYLRDAASKLDITLAFFDKSQGLQSSTPHFPASAGPLVATAEGTLLFEAEGAMWAADRFQPEFLRELPGSTLEVAAAVDVTKTNASVSRHLRLTLGILAVIALVAIAVGARVASVMSRGLAQVIDAYRRLAQQQYVRVPVLKTRDELELLATGFNQMVEGLKERDQLRTTFGKYMTESVVQHLLSGKVTLGGETLRVTILFSDIRSFTSISEKMEAHALVALLNEYFTEMVSIVMRNGGVVDKYIGDAIMAVFGAPVPTEQDAANAVRAAVQMRQALARLNERLQARGMEPLRTGIGIHTGDVVAGNIGSEQRMEYTVIGDPVNVASRLESNTKELKVDVLISDATYEATKEIIEARPVKELSVKGRAEPVLTYEVLGLRAES